MIEQILADNCDLIGGRAGQVFRQPVAQFRLEIGIASRFRLVRREPVLLEGMQEAKTAGELDIFIEDSGACPHRRDAGHVAARIELRPHHVELAGDACPRRAEAGKRDAATGFETAEGCVFLREEYLFELRAGAVRRTGAEIIVTGLARQPLVDEVLERDMKYRRLE